MDFELPPEIRAFQVRVRRFVQEELIPIENESNQHERMPEELSRRLREKAKAEGLWLLDVPREHGGQGLGLLASCVAEEELAKTKALPFRHHNVFGPRIGPILYECNEEQKQRFLYPVIRGELQVCFAQTEPEAGSDPASMRTRAVREGDHYILNGYKRFITFADEADYAQVVCVTDPEKGARGGISVLMVDMKAPGVQLIRRQPTMMGDEPWEIRFENVRVPVEDRIGREGEGFRLAQRWLTFGRVRGHGARCVGIAQRALDLMLDHVRTQTALDPSFSEHQAIQFMIADSAIELRAARLMVYETAWRFDRGEDVRNESYMVKVFCTEMAGRVVDRAIQATGSAGLTRELPLEYWYRQLRSIRITEGVTEVLRWRLGRNLARAVE